MLVRVYNDNVYPYKEKFKGNWIEIQPKSFVEMDHNEASLFLGTMPGNIQVGANGLQKPESYKMLRIQKDWTVADAPEVKKYVCHACNTDLLTKAAYESHVETMHLEQMSPDDKEAMTVAKKRGRPAKGVKDDTSANRNGGEAKV